MWLGFQWKTADRNQRLHWRSSKSRWYDTDTKTFITVIADLVFKKETWVLWNSCAIRSTSWQKRCVEIGIWCCQYHTVCWLWFGQREPFIQFNFLLEKCKWRRTRLRLWCKSPRTKGNIVHHSGSSFGAHNVDPLGTQEHLLPFAQFDKHWWSGNRKTTNFDWI
jgi:hypothetical protein